ncbi:CLUMA_CG015994, isoform A [Clunio marinus]|uniref:CLUMA_CG015994, isoform A n=1 Tax=Clunio marinus TaxID=568069 RepID=A0A1J1IRH2_9DIPT|nr:CLUMA_CG015994, isoform A [Clunio marinus]
MVCVYISIPYSENNKHKITILAFISVTVFFLLCSFVVCVHMQSIDDVDDYNSSKQREGWGEK